MSKAMLNAAQKIIATLNKNGFKSYLVGGCVRNLIMERPMTDIDITTSARPEEVMEIFALDNIYAIPTGLEHGTVTVVHHGINFEVTTFRKDIETDGRRSTVEFGSSLEEDLLRRDFTMNAIAYCPKDVCFIDPYGGINDIKNKIIRAVGVPIDRFREDYLRMLRAHRFEAILEFIIDKPTFGALVSAASDDWSEIISVERIREEINKCFKQADKPSIMFEGMRKSGLLRMIFPEIVRCFGFAQNKYHEYDLYFHTLSTLDATSKDKYLIRWSALLHDIGKIDACENYGPDVTFYGHERDSVEKARKIMKRLKFSNNEKAIVLNLVKHHMFHYSDDMKDSSVRRLVASVGVENMEDLCMLRYADRVGKEHNQSSELQKDDIAVLKRLDNMTSQEKTFGVKDLAINGREIMEIKNIPSSPKVGKILLKLYEIIIEDTSLNTNEQLRKMVEEI